MFSFCFFPLFLHDVFIHFLLFEEQRLAWSPIHGVQYHGFLPLLLVLYVAHHYLVPLLERLRIYSYFFFRFWFIHLFVKYGQVHHLLEGCWRVESRVRRKTLFFFFFCNASILVLVLFESPPFAFISFSFSYCLFVRTSVATFVFAEFVCLFAYACLGT